MFCPFNLSYHITARIRIVIEPRTEEAAINMATGLTKLFLPTEV